MEDFTFENERVSPELNAAVEELRCAQLWDRQSEKQEAFSGAPQRIRVAFGGNRSGKSHVLAQEVCMFAFGAHKFRSTQDVSSPCEIWLACPSYDVQKDTVQKKLEEMIPRHRIKDIAYVKKDVWGTTKLDNGSILTFKSYDQGRSKFQGAGKRLIAFDEEPPEDIWEEATMRVEAGQPLDIILSMTPVNGMSWVYDRIYLDQDNPDLYVTTFGWKDNPWLAKEQLDQMSRGLTEDALKVRRDGEFVQRVGLVCGWYRTKTHLSMDLQRQNSWNIYRIIDFGWSSSRTCVLWIGVDSYDRVYVFDGIYENELDDDHLAEIIKKKEMDFTITKCWMDNQPDRIKALQNRGVYGEPVKKSGGEDSWDTARTEAMARVGRIDPVTGKSRLLISSKLTEVDPDTGRSVNWFVKEVEGLRWKEKRIQAGAKVEVARWDKDASRGNSHFDAIDAFSYFCVMSDRGNRKYRNVPDNIQERIWKKDGIKNKTARRIINPLTGY